MSTGPDRLALGEARSRVRGAVRRLLEEQEGHLGLLLDPAGTVHAASGNPGEVDPVTFASLASHYLLAGQGLATLLVGAEFSRLIQERAGSRIVLLAVADGRFLALLGPSEGTGERGRSPREPDVAELDEALIALGAIEETRGTRKVGRDWVKAAESQVESIFREGGVPPCR